MATSTMLPHHSHSPRANVAYIQQQQQYQHAHQSYSPRRQPISAFEDDDDDDEDNSNRSPPPKPVRRGAPKSSRSRGKKVNAVSQSSLATFHPGYMGGDNEMEPSWSQSSAGSTSTASGADPFSPYQSAFSPQSQGSPTPELEAFAVTDMETALTQPRRGSMDEDEYYDSRHGRRPTMASVFEDDADPAELASAASTRARRVAFKMRTASTDSTKSFNSPGKQNKQLPGSSTGNASPLARFFNWRKIGGGSAKNSTSKLQQHQGGASPMDDSVPSSAPPHITTFADSCRSPGLEPDYGSEGVGGGNSLPNTPLNHMVALPGAGSPALGGNANLMPHRRPGPPPRSILRKQSAPALRGARSAQEAADAAAWPPRSFEAPASFSNRKDAGAGGAKRRNPPTALLGLSNSSSSELSSSSTSTPTAERTYSTVGRGVARDRSTSFGSLSSAGGQKSPTKRKPANKRFENMPHSPSPNSPAMRLYSPPTQPVRMTGSNNMVTQQPVSSLPKLPSLSLSTTSMAQQVADGLLNHGRGFEEPAPRSLLSPPTQPSPSLSVEQPAQSRTLRRRSRSVGAMDIPDVLGGGDDAPRVQTELAPSRAAVGIGRGQPRPVEVAVGGAQRSPPAPTVVAAAAAAAAPSTTATTTATAEPLPAPASPGHKASNSVQSNLSDSSDSGDSAEIHTVQARRVQLVNTRVKATAVSSPSLASVTKSPLLGASPRLGSSPSPRIGTTSASPSLTSSNASPLLAAPRMLHGVAPSTPQRQRQSEGSTPLAVSPASTLGLSSEDDTTARNKRWSRHDSCLLALSFAELDANARENEEGGSAPGRTLDFGFPPCPPTAPLNIKPREQRTRLVTNVSDASDVSLSSSLSSVADSELSEDESVQGSAMAAAVPRIVAFGSDGSMGSMPSLTSSDSEMSESDDAPRREQQQQQQQQQQRTGGLMVMPHSTSSTSISTIGTSILDVGMPHEEAQRYVHRAQLSEDAFSGSGAPYESGADADERTPTLKSGAFNPSINVIGPDTKPQLTLDFEPGGSLGLSLGPLASRRGSNASASSRRSSRRSSRTVTPTQQMFASQKTPSPNRRPSDGGNGLGLGLAFGFGGDEQLSSQPQVQPQRKSPMMSSPKTMEYAYSPHMVMGQRADYSDRVWEDDVSESGSETELCYARRDSGGVAAAYRDEEDEWEMGVAM